MRFTAAPTDVNITGYATDAIGELAVDIDGTLTCSASGYPAVTYHWEWNDGVAELFAAGPTLAVTEIGLINFTCTAVNALGSTSTTVQIGVIGRRWCAK